MPLGAMADYLNGLSNEGPEIDSNDEEGIASVYAQLKSEMAPASGQFGENPESDPLYDLPVRLRPHFEALLAKYPQNDEGYKLAA